MLMTNLFLYRGERHCTHQIQAAYIFDTYKIQHFYNTAYPSCLYPTDTAFYFLLIKLTNKSSSLLACALLRQSILSGNHAMTLVQERWKMRIVILLLAFSAAAISFQSLKYPKVLRIDNNPSFALSAVDDSGNGGATRSRAEKRGDRNVIICDIAASAYAWPFCEASFDLRPNSGKDAGTDLSNFSRVQLWLKFTSPNASSIRVQVRNFNSAYSKNEATLKYSAIELYNTQQNPITVPLTSFQVPTWWIVTNKIPPELSNPDFSNAIAFEVATGSNIKPGHYEIEIERIELQGKYLDNSTLYLGLLLLWGCAAIFYIVERIKYIRDELAYANQHRHKLEELNSLLHVKSKDLEERLTRDPLTGTLNREGIAFLFDIHNNKYNGSKLSLIFIDIDYFKRVNDTYGHLTGDQVLIQFAKV
ncbi:MAG: GGDEF domain-containing protein [Gammaproteobacteria bacterium]|nr:MAG: GGDEF domain-containing protein [Gammaproteobacteria bacterium]